ncbi:centaurin-gamma-1A-like isoform X1 [Centruroides sculpturatus]|uniref:centaurin-gamma-1A-like isoform X1 n=2 Tax=Centruroides sculpturatus TaxID=218467 RepID=UPI000C6EFE1F|nr:centaurin-gamma-1A-like isoform X1 [Centruroides sculpturatus]
MSNKCHVQQPYYSNSLAIRQEIQRFESVHPSIYAIYDLLELIPDPLLAQQIREHVVCIEDSFVNSQEWTLSRSVPDLRLGIVGSLSSGKSALVHRYLTGSYMQDESPEGGRFKKEVVIEGQSYLLLIRDEGGTPELQFSCWVDAVIFVFSLENEPSFNAICNYYTKMSHYRNAAEVPLVLVGTQDAISESNPRVIDDSRARKLASDLKRCSYYETCATYGLNVERVFQDACHKIVQQKIQGLTPNSSRPGTPINHPVRCNYYIPGSVPLSNNHIIAQSNGYTNHPAATPTIPNSSQMVGSVSYSHAYHGQNFMKDAHQWEREMKSDVNGTNMLKESKSDKIERSFIVDSQQISNTVNKESKDIPTPCSTPTTSRKSRRRSNLFTPLKKDDDKKLKNGEVGSGRYIPLRQGYLYKRSCKTLNKEWKKKYVTLTNDARLTYHPSLHDYMDDIHGKEIPLMHTTVKIPGQKPRGSRTQGTISVQHINELASDISSLSLASSVLNGNDTHLIPAVPSTNPLLSKLDTPNIKKRHRRMKSTGAKNLEMMDDSDGYEFIIVSLDNKQWHFEATSTDDREAWVSAIEQQILNSLQGNESSKSKTRLNNLVDTASIQAIRTSIPGNTNCADCDAPNPDWASLNIGALLCIECSGTHRNLGSHISRIRSLDLDEWPPEHISVMMSLGNTIANSIWEGNIRGRAKPTPNSSREEKERWIRSKYELKEFLASTNSSMTIGQQLIDSVCKSDIKSVALVLAHVTSPDQVNVPVSPRDMRLPLHLAAALGNLAICQLLIWYNANVKAIDSDGRSPMVYAKNAGSQEIQDLLRNNGCPDTVVHTSNTMPKRRGSLSQKSSEVFDKLPASII